MKAWHCVAKGVLGSESTTYYQSVACTYDAIMEIVPLEENPETGRPRGLSVASTSESLYPMRIIE
jgi:hypothetical protein